MSINSTALLQDGIVDLLWLLEMQPSSMGPPLLYPRTAYRSLESGLTKKTTMNEEVNIMLSVRLGACGPGPCLRVQCMLVTMNAYEYITIRRKYTKEYSRDNSSANN